MEKINLAKQTQIRTNLKRRPKDKNLSSTRCRGRDAESKAEIYLVQNGLQIIARNIYVRRGELDFVGFMNDTLHIIEVRSRSSDEYSQEMILGPKKALAVKRSADQFLISKKAIEFGLTRFRQLSFDLVVVCPLDIHWIQNYF